MTTKPPAELGRAGAALWRLVTKSLQFEDPREQHALRQACRLEDDVVRLRGQLLKASLVTVGSTGQPVESPLLGSIRQAVALQGRLFASISILEPNAAERSHDGRALVAHRWSS